jgi:hypothetical protein
MRNRISEFFDKTNPEYRERMGAILAFAMFIIGLSFYVLCMNVMMNLLIDRNYEQMEAYQLFMASEISLETYGTMMSEISATFLAKQLVLVRILQVGTLIMAFILLLALVNLHKWKREYERAHPNAEAVNSNQNTNLAE